MEGLIRAEGASDVTVLRNDEVTRTTVETALHALGLRSHPGDWIVVYYSGHGAQAEAAVKGTADGDLDQFLPLARFDPDKQDPERFIVDKDFYAWMARYIPRSVHVLMVADACHSGTLNRSIDPRAFHFTPRLAFRGSQADFTLVARPGPRFNGVLDSPEAVPGGSLERADLPNLIYLGAAQDEQLALEASLPVEGAPARGLMTYALEQGLTARGPDGRTLAADANADGKVSVAEAAIYVAAQVRALTGNRQESAAHFAAADQDMALFAKVAVAAPAPPGAPLPWVFATDPRLLAMQDAPWRVAADRARADFVWDDKSGQVLRRSGDVVAERVTTVSVLRGVVEKWNAVEALRPYLSETAARVMVGPRTNGARYHGGETIALTLARGAPAAAARQGGFATVFDIASDGTVQLLYPLPADGTGALASGASLPPLQNRVVAPFGADHVLALVTPTEPVQFRALLRTADNQRAAARLVAPIRAELARAPGRASLSVGELYTGE